MGEVALRSCLMAGVARLKTGLTKFLVGQFSLVSGNPVTPLGRKGFFTWRLPLHFPRSLSLKAPRSGASSVPIILFECIRYNVLSPHEPSRPLRQSLSWLRDRPILCPACSLGSQHINLTVSVAPASLMLWVTNVPWK